MLQTEFQFGLSSTLSALYYKILYALEVFSPQDITLYNTICI